MDYIQQYITMLLDMVFIVVTLAPLLKLEPTDETDP
jgi:hypothetical protein